jgi:hypothetical protein
MIEELNGEKTVTTNGAVAYKTSGKALLDFNFGVSAMRNMNPEQIEKMFLKVFFEDRKTALEYLFYLGDVRGGLGERKAFRACMDYLIHSQPTIANAVAHLIPYYNRWDSVLPLLNEEDTQKCAVDLIKCQLEEDLKNARDNKPISLLAKWLPSINASSAGTKDKAKLLCKQLGLTDKRYRQMLSHLRKYLNVVEVKMSAKKWGAIDYESVPSKANLVYADAFMRNDGERRTKYLKALQNGEAKINASVANPDEICHKYIVKGGRAKDETLEALWKALPNLSTTNTLVVRDGSSSMTWSRIGNGSTPLDVATALAIYMSEHNTGGWKDKYVTFSANPKVVDLSKCRSLAEKIQLSMNEADCSNTNIYATMMLILKTAWNHRMKQEDMPELVVICSDMQFDGRRHNFNSSLFDEIAREYESAGYKLPRICFWNLSGHLDSTIPMQQNDLGLILCSGFSINIMKMFMSGKIDPYEVLLDALHSDRYDKVREVIATL